MNDKDRVAQFLSQHPYWGRLRIAKALGMAENRVRLILAALKSSGYVSNAPQGQSLVIDESSASKTITAKGSEVRSLDDLIAYAKVDLSQWEVSRHRINSWESVMREPATTVGGSGYNALIVEGKDGARSTLWTRGSSEPVKVRLFQVDATFTRKSPLVTATESLLKQIEAKAPLLKAPFIRKAKLSGRRALEVCIMDPHIGLLCNYPEADGPWDIDLASQTIMTAIDTLIDRARPFGPFEQVFLPFGNDFVHSDTVFHETTAGTGQPEAEAWHRVYDAAERIAIEMILRLRVIAKKVFVYEVPGNHSRMADFTLARLLRAYFRTDSGVTVDASSSPYKFHRYGVNLIGYEHGHSVKPIRLAALMANERPKDWSETEYREFHLGDQHRKGSSKPSMLEEQGVSVEYVPGLTAPNEWHRLKSFSHQQRGAMSFVWDYSAGPIARFQFNISKYSHKPLVDYSKN